MTTTSADVLPTGQADPAEYYSRQYNARAGIPDHPYIFTRWLKDSTHVRRTNAGLYNLAFGETEAERIDFFPTPRSGAPLLVFIHGGWWRSLDKTDFSFVAPAYTRAGYNVALTNYTLAPKASIAEIVREQLSALAWLYHHAEAYDFDRERIVVAGHSAGAHLAAMMMAAVWPAFDPALPVDLVKGGILMSGIYDLAPILHADFVNVDLKLREDDIAPLSPAGMPQSHSAPFITAAGGLESDEFRRQTDLLAGRWRNNHREDVSLPGINHLTICDAFATPGHALHDASLRLLASLDAGKASSDLA
ncbi:alpha/beta hydrolase [Noviherbaspirillum galbum]|uniref:Alpha/beta hydrolase n=1 Tax=Noviherbaspirillum galbum TaxID=2709383 RepID=A0A6B3SN20_9BURK|nr:alpha/beta hydrolase [Noviherbaspirillum galbum]NEX62077.1 alpha/beta hydrolase [Noviherbaspirillum galbum]